MISARCDIFAASVQLEQIERPHITNETYLAAFDKTAKSLKVALGLKKTYNPQQLAEITIRERARDPDIC